MEETSGIELKRLDELGRMLKNVDNRIELNIMNKRKISEVIARKLNGEFIEEIKEKPSVEKATFFVNPSYDDPTDYEICLAMLPDIEARGDIASISGEPQTDAMLRIEKRIKEEIKPILEDAGEYTLRSSVFTRFYWKPERWEREFEE